MKKIFLKISKLSFSIAIVSLFIACGSGGGSSSSSSESKTEKISKRQYVMISYHYPKEVCNSSVLKESLESMGFTDIVNLVTNDYVDCQSYGKSNDGRECLIQDLNYYNEPTCVGGMNHSTRKSYKSNMTNDILSIEDIKDTMISAF